MGVTKAADELIIKFAHAPIKKFKIKITEIAYSNLLTSGTLNSYLSDIDGQAQERLETLAEQMKQSQGITEQLIHTKVR